MIEVNVDSTGLGSANCDLKFHRTVVEGYKEQVMKSSMVYGIGFHKFIDVMYKTKGDFKLAHARAQDIFLRIPKISDKKAEWLEDTTHLRAVCNQGWLGYALEDGTFNVLEGVKIECVWCEGTGLVPHSDGLPSDIVCSKCNGYKFVIGPATEINFSIPFYKTDICKFNLCGTVDTVGKIINGCNLVRDWKTTSSWDVKKYFTQYEMSRQLRIYSLVLKLMHQIAPDSILGKIGGDRIGARIDAVFLKPKPNDTVITQSQVFQYSDGELSRFADLLKKRLAKFSEAIKNGTIQDQEGLVNGTCEGKWGKCSYWNICKNSEGVGKILLERDFVKVPYNPLSFNE